MPFVSQAQRGYLFVHHPEIAKEFAKATPKGKKLPYHKAKSKLDAKKAAHAGFMRGLSKGGY